MVVLSSKFGQNIIDNIFSRNQDESTILEPLQSLLTPDRKGKRKKRKRKRAKGNILLT